MATPLVSVLMTAYNRKKYIAEAIESVLASTFQDFELIIVDDCSRDHTVEIVRLYTSDPRLQVHVNEKNLGDYPNRNRAASLAKGQYLKYVDSDDYIYPRGLQIMVEMFEPFTQAAVGFCSLGGITRAIERLMRRTRSDQMGTQSSHKLHSITALCSSE